MSVLAHDPNPLDHLQFCIRNPYHSTCLANTGIPVFLPSVLGGYIGNNYIGANALFVTFSLSNMFYHEAEYLQWEQNFLKLIDSTLFSRIRVSYSAEVYSFLFVSNFLISFLSTLEVDGRSNLGRNKT